MAAAEELGTAAAAAARVPLGNTTRILMAVAELVHLLHLRQIQQGHVEAKVCQKELPL